ncbi:MAG: galactose-1-phosphate uridylyltransferase [Candidatus Methylomirabilota bacterium]|nr:galactose-1-phosphate uridylyltransferase [candidate division NC10 bacterium]PWB43895.1 MAG: galactose-1-phosphate uridylyltransferase [candidate division NC10 bacterium]
MPQLRKDPITSRWVIISTERGKRPLDFPVPPPSRQVGFCPFCPGNEDKTPPEVLAYRKNGNALDRTGWSLRVVPNKFPALQIEGELDRAGDGIYDKMHGLGAHEVIIESPNHNDVLSAMPEQQVEDVLWAYRDRILDLKKDDRFQYILIFKNHGEQAGASLEHPHSQLIATPIVPKRAREEVDGAKAYFEYKDRCIFCDMIRQELKQALRVIARNDEFVAIAPFASRFPFETWILPRRHEPFFHDAQKYDMVSCSRILKEVLGRMNQVLGNPPYNYLIHSTPLQETATNHYHWHIEIMPTLVKVAGFEWGTGFYINPVLPEDAAKHLREARL